MSSCVEFRVLEALARHTLLHDWPGEGYGRTQQRAEYRKKLHLADRRLSAVEVVVGGPEPIFVVLQCVDIAPEISLHNIQEDMRTIQPALMAALCQSRKYHCRSKIARAIGQTLEVTQ